MSKDQQTEAYSGRACGEWVRDFYSTPVVLDHYRRATGNIGLWISEEKLFCELFAKDDRILDLGTGTGRIALGLAELGYRHLMGMDLSKEMIKEARRIARLLELAVSFRQGDATALKLDDGLFDGVIFGFNGLMQIPGRDNRLAAMREVRRVLRPGGRFVFTSHDRELPKYRKFWEAERRRWNAGKQNPALIDFGDRWEMTDLGQLFIHVPVPAEVREDLKACGFKVEWDRLRSTIAVERPATRQFSDECRFWCASAMEEGAG
jgi:ubiquinone/menaquinone biosynthesis C-methylase UbiE